MYIEEDKKLFGLTKFSKLTLAFTGLIFGLILTRIFLLTPHIVQDNSMKPGLKKGDYVLILKFLNPQPGDIVLMESPIEPDKVILKRLISMGAKQIEIENKKIFIDQKKIKLGWNILYKDNRIFSQNFSNRDNLPNTYIKAGQVFVLGDNLDYSYDSRDIGPIDKKLIIGKMVYKF